MSLEQLKELRDKSGAGMVDCKKALDESGGDMEKAIEILRKKGVAKAAKRSERETSEGVVKVAVNDGGNEGYMIELDSETDFVARNEKFQTFADAVLSTVSEKKPADLDALLSLPMDGRTVKEALDGLSGTTGEKMQISRLAVLGSGGSVAVYSHLAGRIGVLVALDKTGEKELAYDIAMQIAAADPKYLRPEDVPAEEIDKEKEIYREQLAKEGKPENIIEKIMTGKLDKYFSEVCLLKQEYIKDDKKKVEEILGDVKVEKFFRFSL